MSNESKRTPKDSWHRDQYGHIYESFNPEKSEGEVYTERHIATLAPTAKPGEGGLIASAPELLNFVRAFLDGETTEALVPMAQKALANATR